MQRQRMGQHGAGWRGVVLGLGVTALVACGGGTGGTDGGGADGGGGGGSDGGADAGALYQPQLPADVDALGFGVVKQGSQLVAFGAASRPDGGTRGTDLFAARFDLQGRLDTSFGQGGLALADADGGETAPLVGTLHNDVAYAAVVDGTTGALTLAGTSRASLLPADGTLALLRLSASGVRDAAFGNLGGVRVDAYTNEDGVVGARYEVLVRQPDGKLLAAGTVQEQYVVVRYNADGSPDATYNNGGAGAGFGSSIYGDDSRQEAVRGAVLQADGKLVVGGGSGLFLARLDAQGRLDTTFGTSGFTRASGAPGSAVLGRPDGRLLVLGVDNTSAGGSNVAFLRLLQTDANGRPDEGFGPGGRRDVQLPFATGVVRGAALAADGALVLYVAGGLQTHLVRVTAAGALDTAFGTGGARALDVQLPLLQPSWDVGNHLLLDGSTAWVADVSLEKVAEPNERRAFFVLRRYAL
jgi:uncharacterized delta-60 repeat protein